MSLRSSFIHFSAAFLPLVLFGVFPVHAASSPDDDAKAGAILFRDKGCAHCHGSGGAGTKKAPSLSNIRDDKTWPADKITDQILDGGAKMPPFRDSLSDDEIAKLVAYLRAKHRPDPPDGSAPPPPPSSPSGP